MSPTSPWSFASKPCGSKTIEAGVRAASCTASNTLNWSWAMSAISPGSANLLDPAMNSARASARRNVATPTSGVSMSSTGWATSTRSGEREDGSTM